MPLLAVSGDDRLETEIAEQFPAARSITVKRCINATAAESLSPGEAREKIEQEVCGAVERAADAVVEAPCRPPLTIDVSFSKQLFADAAALMPFAERTGALDIRFGAGNHAEAIGILSGFSLMAAALA